jgi:hypothetical protein
VLPEVNRLGELSKQIAIKEEQMQGLQRNYKSMSSLLKTERQSIAQLKDTEDRHASVVQSLK